MMKGVSGAKALLGEAENLYRDAEGHDIQGFKALGEFIDSLKGILKCPWNEYEDYVLQSKQNISDIRDLYQSTEGRIIQANNMVGTVVTALGHTGAQTELLVTGEALIDRYSSKNTIARLDSVILGTEELAGTTVQRIHTDVETVITEAQQVALAMHPMPEEYAAATGLCRQLHDTL